MEDSHRRAAETQDHLRTSLATSAKGTERRLLDGSQELEQVRAELEQLWARADSCEQSVAQALNQASPVAQLAHEQSDHSQAIHNIMDLLESSATRAEVADSQALAEALADETARGVEEQLKQMEEQTNAAIQQQAADFDHILAQMEAARAAEVTSAVGEVRAELGVVRQAASQMSEEGTAKLALSVKELERQLGRRMSELERRNSQVAQSAEMWGDRVQTQGIASDQLAASLLALESKTEAAVQLLHKETDHQVRQVRDSIDDRCTAIETRSSNATKQLHDSLAQQASSLSTDLQASVDSVESRLTGLRSQVDTTMLRADGVLRLTETLETRLEEKLGDSSASFEARLVSQVACELVACLLDLRFRCSRSYTCFCYPPVPAGPLYIKARQCGERNDRAQHRTQP